MMLTEDVFRLDVLTVKRRSQRGTLTDVKQGNSAAQRGKIKAKRNMSLFECCWML